MRKCLKRCRHCRIFFLTHPRNAVRNDLRCPFGCRQAHLKESAKARSDEYYRSREGKIKKKELNARRTQGDTSQKLPKESKTLPPKALETPLDSQIIIHIQTVTSLIEERVVPLNDILCMINRILRQRSINIGEKIIYAYSNRCQGKNQYIQLLLLSYTIYCIFTSLLRIRHFSQKVHNCQGKGSIFQSLPRRSKIFKRYGKLIWDARFMDMGDQHDRMMKVLKV